MVWKGHIMSVSVIGLRSPHLKNEVSYTDLPWSTYLAWRKLKTTWALVLSKTASRAKPRPIYCRIFWAIVSCESISRYLKGIYTVSACICHYFLALFWITTCHREVLLRKWSIWTSLGWCWHTSCASFVVQGLHGASNRAIGARNKTITNGTNQKSIQDDLHGDLIKTHIKKVPFYILSIYFYAFLPLRKMLPKPIWKLKAVLWQ